MLPLPLRHKRPAQRCAFNTPYIIYFEPICVFFFALYLTSPAAGCTVGSVVVTGAPLPANSFVHSLAGVFGITVTDAMQATFLFRMFYIWLATSLVRFKYYMAWKLAEGLRF